MIIGYTTGVYDMFHVGHLRLLERAKLECDRLIVGVTTDELSLSAKGKTPIVLFEERREIVSALKCVDQVVAQTSMNKMSAWNQWGFNRIFVGDDWAGTPRWKVFEDDFARVGVEVRYFAYTPNTSSTMLRSALEAIIDSSSAERPKAG